MTTRDHFAALGLERRFALDRELLEQRYLERAAAAHPDRVATAASEVRRAAMEESAALNAAYGVLRNPVARLEHLVALAGIDLDSSDRERGAPHPERAFLIDMIERREQLDALAGELEAREAQRMQVEDERDALFAVAQAALERGEVREAALALVHRRYLQRLLDEFETS